MSSKAIQQYIDRYAEPEAALSLALTSIEQRNYVIVIPAYDEDFTFLRRLSEHADASALTAIIVINEPDTGRQSRNHLLLANVAKRCEIRGEEKHVKHVRYKNLQIIIVERCLPLRALPEKQGVGLARKMGCDIATAYINAGLIRQPWIYSTDADAQLPERYFSDSLASIAKHKKTDKSISALVFNFNHTGGETDTLDATLLYQRCLRYFRDQLRDADSPYAFYTLGSCLALSMEHYCQARGFPKRSGGEDFYMLNKLAKLGAVLSLDDICVALQARVSHRVPFGTGPAVRDILEKTVQGIPIRYYDPHIFTELKTLYSHLDMLWENRSISELPEPCVAALQKLGFNDFFSKRQQQDRTLVAFLDSFHCWFDAFRTLKFIHYLQEHHYPAVIFFHNK